MVRKKDLCSGRKTSRSTGLVVDKILSNEFDHSTVLHDFKWGMGWNIIFKLFSNLNLCENYIIPKFWGRAQKSSFKTNTAGYFLQVVRRGLENPLAFLFLFFNLRECPAGVLWLPGYNIKGYFKTGWTAHLSKNWENSCLKVQTILILCWQKMKTKTEHETLAFWTEKQHQGDATGRWCGMHSHR